jgi:hemoglobin
MKPAKKEVKNDITQADDIRVMVDRFYDKVKTDPLLGPVFNHVDWPNHLPIMYDFWSSVLLGTQTYRGNPFQKHLHLKIDQRHFNRWLVLFEETVDANFTGEKTKEAKVRARAIAEIFQLKMGLVAQIR